METLILKYGFCTTCSQVQDLKVTEDDKKFRITWDDSLQSFTKYHIKLYVMRAANPDEPLDINEELIFDRRTELKYVDIFKTTIGDGNYRFEIIRICNNQESEVSTISFSYIFTGGLEQRLIT